MKKQKGNELIQRFDLKDSPFTIIKTDKNEVFGTLGKYRITELYGTVEECRKELKKITWNRITQVMQLLIENQAK